jgi:NADH:ubiquinone reductase (H+-translocating)
VEVVLVDRRNYHIFQPLLYQAAKSVLVPSEVAAPIRQLARKQRDLTVVLGEATGIDLAANSIRVSSSGVEPLDLPFDYLVVAAGMRPSYVGHDEFAMRRA